MKKYAGLLSGFLGNAGAGAAIALAEPTGTGMAALLLGYVVTGVLSCDSKADDVERRRHERLHRWLRLGMQEQRATRAKLEEELELNQEARGRLDEVAELVQAWSERQQEVQDTLRSLASHSIAHGRVTAEAAEVSRVQLEEVLRLLRSQEEGTPEFSAKEARRNLNRARTAFDASDFEAAKELSSTAYSASIAAADAELTRDALRMRIVCAMNASIASNRRQEHSADQWMEDLKELESLGGDASDVAVLRARVALMARDYAAFKGHLATAKGLTSPGSARAVEVAMLNLQACRPSLGGDGLVSLLLEQKHLEEVLESAANDQKARLLVSLIATRVELKVPLEEAPQQLGDVARNVAGEDRSVVLLELKNLTRILLSRSLWDDATVLGRAAHDLGRNSDDVLQIGETSDLLAHVLSEQARQVPGRERFIEEAVSVRRAAIEGLLRAEGCEPEELREEPLQAYIPLLANCLRDEVHIASRTPSANVAETWKRLDDDCRRGVSSFSARKRTLKGDVAAVESVLVCLQGDISVGRGRYVEAAAFFARGSSIARKAKVSHPALRFRAASDAAYFSTVGGDHEAAKAFLDEAEEFASTPESRDVLKNHRAMLEHVQSISAWVESDDALALAETAKRRGVREALRPTIARVVQHWEDSKGPCPVLYDYWGRGGFQRIAAAIRGVPDDVIAVDATSVEQVERAAQFLCPLFETVVVKWKGELAQGIAVTEVRDGRDVEAGWLCGAGYVNCANTSPDMYGVVGMLNSVPPEVVEWLGGPGRQLFEAGRIVIAPAVQLGCVQTAFGWTDDALLGRYLKGVVVGLGGAVSTTGGPTIDLAAVAFPFVGGRSLSMEDLALTLDDLGDAVTPFRRRMLSVLGEQEAAPYSWSQKKALRLEIEEAFAEIRKRVQGVVKNTSFECSETHLKVDAAERMEWVGRIERAELLSGASGSRGRNLKAWLPLWRLKELGGSFDWAAPPSLGTGSAEGVMTSWLSPPSVGAGFAVSHKV